MVQCIMRNGHMTALKRLFLQLTNEVWDKVMFSQVFVCPWGGEKRREREVCCERSVVKGKCVVKGGVVKGGVVEGV